MRLKILCLILILIPSFIKAGYTILKTGDPGGPAFSWIDISATGTPLNIADDNAVNIVAPFAVPLWGNTATQLRVGNNGAILFDAVAGNIEFANLELSNALTPDNLVAVFWDDMDDAPGNVYYQSTGVAPNRQFVISWEGYSRFQAAGVGDFQVVFTENSSNILFQYLDVDFSNVAYDYGNSATVGLKRAGNMIQQVSYNSTAVLSNNLAVQFLYSNSAPVLNTGGSPKLSSIAEGILVGNNTGTKISSFISSIDPINMITDANGDDEGIAVYSVDEVNGAWSYSLNDGGSWTAVAPVAAGSALLLSADTQTRLRFQPSDADWTGSATFLFRAWDLTQGENGEKTDVSTNGGTTAYSSDFETGTITVINENDAPVLTNTGQPAWTAIDEDDAAQIGNTVAQIIAGLDAPQITDVDPGAVEGIAVVAVTNTNGQWQWTINGGSAWTNFSVSAPAANNARLLADDVLTRIRFYPDNNYNGAVTGNITFRAWDQTGAGVNGGAVDITVVGTSGITPFSANSVTSQSITVNAVNDPPVHSIPGAQSMNEEATLTFNAANSNLISVSDADAGGAAVQTSISATNGTLTLSGIVGLAFTVGDGAADAAMTFTGTIAAINTALDGISYTPTLNYFGAATLTLSTNDQGNTPAPAQQDDDQITINVQNVNDAPVLVTNLGLTVGESATGTITQALLQVTDVDNTAAQIAYTLSALPTHGQVRNNGAGLGIGGSFTQDDIDNSRVTFVNNGDEVANDQFTFTVSDGAGGSIGATVFAITVTLANDAPVNSVPGAQTTAEDTPLTFNVANSNLISISDDDAGGGDLQVVLSGANGVITLSGIAGLAFTVGDGAADAAMTFTGPLAAINTALDGLIFTPTPAFSGAGSIQINTDDQGNSGLGGAQSDLDNIAITISAVNDAPVNSVPGAQNINEDAPLTFNAGNGNLISIADGDAGAGVLLMNLTASNGTVTLSGIAGLIFSAGDGAADAAMTFTGALAAINIALDGLIFTPTSNFNGVAGLQITTNDQGNTGSGGAQSDVDNIVINVASLNDAPINSVPAAQVIDEDAVLTFNVANGNLISVSDIDIAAADLQIVLTATNGTLSLSGIGGLAFTVGDGADDATMTFTATQANVNTALAGMTFTPTSQFSGAANLQINSNDQGNTGAGGAQADIDNIVITVTTVNDPPVNSVPGVQTTNEDVPLTFNAGNGNLISISDADVAAGNLQITLTGGSGTVTLSGIVGLAFTTGDGADDVLMTFTGTLANINTSLDGLIFAPATNFNGGATLTILTNDQGNTGPDGAKTDQDIISITVNAQNDAPVNNIPAAQVTDEDTPLTFSSAVGNTIYITDDAGSNPAQLALTATNGVLTLNGVSGLTFTVGDGSADAAMTFTGTLANINTAINGLVFTPTAEYNGAANLQISTDDQGNTGVGGALTDVDNVAITVTAVNDAPINSAPGTQSVNEDASLTFNAANSNLISVSDIDAAAGDMQITLTAVNGTLTLSGIAGLAFTVGDGAADATMTFTATLVNANLALDGLVFVPTPDFYGSATLTLLASDQGNTGSGGVKTDQDLISMTVNGQNDGPALAINLPLTLDEGEMGIITNGQLLCTDIDTDSAHLIYSLATAVTHGILLKSSPSAISLVNGGNSGHLARAAVNDTLGAGDSFTQEDINFSRIHYYHDGTETITDFFQFTVSDGVVTLPAAQFDFLINLRNDLPVLAALDTLIVSEGGSGTLTQADLEVIDEESAANQIQFTLAESPDYGELRLNAAALGVGQQFTQNNINSGGVSYQHDGSETLGDTFRFTVNDGDGGTMASTAFSLVIMPVNDLPVLITNDTLFMNEGDTATINQTLLRSDDVDHTAAQLTYTISTLPTAGQIWVNGQALTLNGTFTQAQLNSGAVEYVHIQQAVLADQFTFTLRDGAGAAVAATQFNIKIYGVNDPPWADNMTVTLLEDHLYNGVLIAGDEENQPLFYRVAINGAKGTFTITDSTQPQFVYTPQFNANGEDSVYFQVNDGVSNSKTAKIVIMIYAVNDKPLFTAGDSILRIEDCGVQMIADWATAISSGAANEASQSISFELLGDGGDLFSQEPFIDETGTLSFNPALNQSGSATWQIVLNDDGGTLNGGVASSDTSQLTITILAVDDPPSFNTAPIPADQARSVSLLPILDWLAEDPEGDAILYDLYFGSENPPPLLATNLTQSRYELSNLQYGSTYFWQVVAKTATANTVSSLWQFVTQYRLEIMSPEEGEIIAGGSSYQIYWQSNSPQIDSVGIAYSVDHGAHFLTIIDGYPNSGHYEWTVPGVNSDECMLKIWKHNELDVYGYSGLFAVRANWFELIQPVNGDLYNTASSQTIKLHCVGLQRDFSFFLTGNGGESWVPLTINQLSKLSVIDTFSFTWLVPSLVSNQCRIRGVYNPNPSIIDESDGWFSIRDGQNLTLIEPNGGEILAGGEPDTIRWVSQGAIERVHLAFSIDNGQQYQWIHQNVSNIGRYSWNVPDIDAAECRVKVIQADDQSVWDISDETFQIARKLIQFTAPLGGAYSSGDTIRVAWQASPVIELLNLYFSADGGYQWQNIVSNKNAATGFYIYTLPDTITAQACFRAQSVRYPATLAQSALFSISRLSHPISKIIRPSADTTIVVGTTIQFEGLEMSLEGVSYRWDFGDGSSSELLNPTHLFSVEGIFRILHWYELDGVEFKADTLWVTVQNPAENYPLYFWNQPQSQLFGRNVWFYWQTNQPGTARLYYGSSPTQLNSSIVLDENDWRHSTIIRSPATGKYYFKVMAENQFQSIYSTLDSFSIAQNAAPDFHTPFLISMEIHPRRNSCALIAEFNEPVRTTLHYGADPNQLISAQAGQTYLYRHLFYIDNLASGQQYYYKILMSDINDNQALYPADAVLAKTGESVPATGFATINEADSAPPQFTLPPLIFWRYLNRLGLAWGCNEPVYFRLSLYQQEQLIRYYRDDQYFSMERILFLEGLGSGLTYRLNLELIDQEGNRTSYNIPSVILDAQNGGAPAIAQAPVVTLRETALQMEWQTWPAATRHARWGFSPDSLIYTLDFKDFNFTHRVFINPDVLDHIVYYQVKNCTPSTCAPWSEIYAFNPTGVNEPVMDADSSHDWVSRVYPNPFNHDLGIELWVKRHQPIKIEIYNMLGQKMETLIQMELFPSIHRIIWQGRDKYGCDLPSGIYFIRISGVTQQEIHKVMRVR